ncbi:MAG TPA: cytochrome c maturation protein CcmE [bacterium]|nr:cytochrome c maturation protein CcmE [bacterium]
MGRSTRRLAVAIAVFVLAGGYLAYSGARSSMSYYLTVGELLDRQASLTAESDIRLSGTVAAQGLVWDQGAGTLQFQVTDGARAIPVRYRGIVPDAFKPGADVVLEGRFDGTTFAAERLFAKCPSKFEAKPRGS